jgi:hypothetical protein
MSTSASVISKLYCFGVNPNDGLTMGATYSKTWVDNILQGVFSTLLKMCVANKILSDPPSIVMFNKALRI